MTYKLKHTCTSYQTLMSLALSCKDSNEKRNLFTKLFNQLDQEKLFKLADIDEVSSHIGYWLEKYNIKADKKWASTKNNITKNISTLMKELDTVSSVLHDHNIKLLALKNAGITRGIYTNYACSPMGDIDLLISPKDFLKGHDLIIKDCGYTFKFRSELEKENIEEAFLHGGTEYYKDVDGHRVWLELQWRPIAGKWIQPHNEPKADDLIKRSISIKGSHIRLLSPEDNLLQVCLHTAKHSFVRAPGFRLHSDVDRIVTLTDINWAHFESLARKLHVKTGSYYSLALAKQLLKTDIPNDILSKLKPNPIKHFLIQSLLLKAGLFNQKKKKFNNVSYIVFNMLLYDSWKDLFQAIFPPPSTIKAQHSSCNTLLLPYYYTKRLLKLIFYR